MEAPTTGYVQTTHQNTGAALAPSAAREIGTVRDALVDLLNYAQQRLGPYLLNEPTPDYPSSVPTPSSEVEGTCRQAAGLIEGIRTVLGDARL